MKTHSIHAIAMLLGKERKMHFDNELKSVDYHSREYFGNVF